MCAHRARLPPGWSSFYVHGSSNDHREQTCRARHRHLFLHIVRFELKKLRQYEAAMRYDPECRVKWAALDPKGGRIDQPSRLEGLQLADLATSAIYPAFEPDEFGNTEPRYLHEIAGRLYRRPPGALTSYGLKVHPWDDQTKATYPWVAAL